MDERELARLYEAHGWHVLARCRRLLGDDEAHDACQEVFLRLAERGAQVRQQSGAAAWVFAVTTNHCIDRLRARRRRRDREAGAPEEVELLSAQATDEEGRLARRDLIARLLPRFSTQEISLALLRHVDGLTLDELEQVCGMTRKTISKKLSRFEARARTLVVRMGG